MAIFLEPIAKSYSRNMHRHTHTTVLASLNAKTQNENIKLNEENRHCLVMCAYFEHLFLVLKIRESIYKTHDQSH